MLESSLSTPEYFKTSFSAVKVYSELIASDTVSINVRFYVRNMAFSVTTAKTMYFPHSLLHLNVSPFFTISNWYFNFAPVWCSPTSIQLCPVFILTYLFLLLLCFSSTGALSSYINKGYRKVFKFLIILIKNNFQLLFL